MATFVVARGAWSAGWGWKKMHPFVGARGHRLITPTLTGVGEHAHLARPDIDLETHIADILGVLEFEDLGGVNLIGHSYGGMVATGVADRARARIARLIYVDAFVPKDGESLFDCLPAAVRATSSSGGGRLADSARADAARYIAGRSRLGRAETIATTAENIRAEIENTEWPADAAAALYLLHAAFAR